jgi:hypothetical protein
MSLREKMPHKVAQPIFVKIIICNNIFSKEKSFPKFGTAFVIFQKSTQIKQSHDEENFVQPGHPGQDLRQSREQKAHTFSALTEDERCNSYFSYKK